MREPTTYIKLDRNIMSWRWFKDPTTLAVWIWLLISASIDTQEYRDLKIERGQVCATYSKISQDMGLSIKQVRTAIQHLTKTGEIEKIGQTQNYPIFNIVGFSRYQDKPADQRQTSGRPGADQRQTSGRPGAGLQEEEECKEYKNYKNDKKGGRAYAREAPKTGAALFEEIGEELRRQEAEEAKRNDAGGNE